MPEVMTDGCGLPLSPEESRRRSAIFADVVERATGGKPGPLTRDEMIEMVADAWTRGATEGR